MAVVMEIRKPNGPTIRVFDDDLLTGKRKIGEKAQVRKVIGYGASLPGAAERLEECHDRELREGHYLDGSDVIYYDEAGVEVRREKYGT